MTALLARTNRGLFGEWWWTLDKAMLSGAGALLFIGLILIFAASPPVAERVLGDDMHYVQRHMMIMPLAGLVLIATSMFSARGVLRLSVAMFITLFILLVMTLIIGEETKGAQRWLGTPVFKLQPSEIIKPALFVLVGWALVHHDGWKGRAIAAGLTLVVLAILLKQPDLGMAILIAAVFSTQLFVAGLGWIWVFAIACVGIGALFSAYHLWGHFADRIDSFLDSSSLGYQIERALGAVSAGGHFGTGPGEGVIKYKLPDAHSDFIFAATAEEFGILACLILVGLFGFIFMRAIVRLEQSSDRFVLVAGTGLAAGFALQAIINMAVNLNLVPTKGMTLPFISYGGSSMIGTAVGIGLLLALTRKRTRLERLG